MAKSPTQIYQARPSECKNRLATKVNGPSHQEATAKEEQISKEDAVQSKEKQPVQEQVIGGVKSPLAKSRDY